MNRLLQHLLLAGLGLSSLLVPLHAQGNLSYGFIPAYLLSGPLSERLQYSLAVDTEVNLLPDVNGEGRDWRWRNADLETALSYDLSPNLNLAAGLQFRVTVPMRPPRGMELRTWQQLTLISRARKFRLRHRFRLEERFVDAPGNPVDFRLLFRMRYRFSVDFPLNGERLDPGECYLNLSSEFLTTADSDDGFFLWQYRQYAGLGYQLFPRHRIEFAPEWRIAKISELDTWENLLLLRVIWVSRIGKRK